MTLTMAEQTEFPQQVMFKGKCARVCVRDHGELVPYTSMQHEGKLFCLTCFDASLCPLFSLQARSTDNLDSSGEPTTRSVGTTASLKGKMSKR